jgi:hypothetical protein
MIELLSVQTKRPGVVGVTPGLETFSSTRPGVNSATGNGADASPLDRQKRPMASDSNCTTEPWLPQSLRVAFWNLSRFPQRNSFPAQGHGALLTRKSLSVLMTLGGGKRFAKKRRFLVRSSSRQQLL